MAPTLTVAPVPTVRTHKGSVAVVTVRAALPPGFHANSNTPTDAYLIPLTLKWTGGPLQADGITYPKACAGKVFLFREAAFGGDRRIQHRDQIQGAGGRSHRSFGAKWNAAVSGLQRSHVLCAEDVPVIAFTEYRIRSRHYSRRRNCPIDLVACRVRCSFSIRAKRTNPSPIGPKPIPGDTATSAFSIRSFANSSDPSS